LQGVVFVGLADELVDELVEFEVPLRDVVVGEAPTSKVRESELVETVEALPVILPAIVVAPKMVVEPRVVL
jgi:hypothetical protein